MKLPSHRETRLSLLCSTVELVAFVLGYKQNQIDPPSASLSLLNNFFAAAALDVFVVHSYQSLVNQGDLHENILRVHHGLRPRATFFILNLF